MGNLAEIKLEQDKAARAARNRAQVPREVRPIESKGTELQNNRLGPDTRDREKDKKTDQYAITSLKFVNIVIRTWKVMPLGGRRNKYNQYEAVSREEQQPQEREEPGEGIILSPPRKLFPSSQNAPIVSERNPVNGTTPSVRSVPQIPHNVQGPPPGFSQTSKAPSSYFEQKVSLIS
jgi:hypothetical protein